MKQNIITNALSKWCIVFKYMYNCIEKIIQFGIKKWTHSQSKVTTKYNVI